MFTIYRGEEIIFLPEDAILAFKYDKSNGTVIVSHKGGKETYHNVDAVNYASKTYPITLKYHK